MTVRCLSRPCSTRPSSPMPAMLAELAAFDPQPGARRRRRRRLEPRQGLSRLHQLRLARTICRTATPPSPTSASCSPATPPSFARTAARPRPQAAARQPVGQSVEKRWATQWAHPPAQHPLGHLLRRGAAGLRRHPLRGPAPAADDGRAAARRSTLRHRPAAPRPAADVGKLAAPRSARRHRQGRTAQHQLQFRLIRCRADIPSATAGRFAEDRIDQLRERPPPRARRSTAGRRSAGPSRRRPTCWRCCRCGRP